MISLRMNTRSDSIRVGKKAGEAIFLNQHELVEIYAEIKSISTDEANRFIDNLINNYKLDIEGFGELVSKYINSKTTGFSPGILC